jgi:hypothetical protein
MKEIFMTANPRTLAALLALALAAGCAPGGGAAVAPVWRDVSPKPYALAPWTAEAPVIDGRLDDAAWRGALKLGPLGPFGSEPNVDSPGSVLLAWNRRALYVAFETSDLEVKAEKRERDGPMWEDDCVEFFLDPTGTGAVYFEIGINAANCIHDYLQVRRKGTGPAAYTGYTAEGMVSAAAARQGGGWIVEAAIPWSDLRTASHMPPQSGETWLFNVVQMDRDSSGTRAATLSPLKSSAHDVALFSRLGFDGAGAERERREDLFLAEMTLARGEQGRLKWNLADHLAEAKVDSAGLGAYAFAGGGWTAPRKWGHLRPVKPETLTAADPPGVLSTHPADQWAIEPVRSDPTRILLPKLDSEQVRVWYRMTPGKEKALASGSCDGAGIVVRARAKEGGGWKALLDVPIRDCAWSLRTLAVPRGAELAVDIDRGPLTADHDVVQMAVEAQPAGTKE